MIRLRGEPPLVVLVVDLARDRSEPRRVRARRGVSSRGLSFAESSARYLLLAGLKGLVAKPSLMAHGSRISLGLEIARAFLFYRVCFLFWFSGFLVLVESWNRRHGTPGWILTVFATPPMHTCTIGVSHNLPLLGRFLVDDPPEHRERAEDAFM